MTETTVVALAQAGTAHGNKAANLAWLIEHGYRVPDGIVVSAADDDGLSGWVRPDRRYAVRSSASVEDSPGFSFAGQFLTQLDLRRPDEVREAVGAVLESATDEGLIPYLQHAGIQADDIRMHVVVQEMVDSRVSGVAFSRNPMTGLADVLVESVPGTGENLVSGRATPQRWLRHWGDWTQQPDAPDLPEPTARELAETVAQVADEWGTPVDVEWSWNGTELYLLQVRPMTVTDVPVYSNRLAKEFLPGVIPPLVWSVNVPVVNSAWLELFESVVGPLDLEPDDLSRQFAYRAYFNMKAVGDIFEAMNMPRDLLEVLLGIEGGAERPRFRPGARAMRHVARVTRMAWRLWRFDREMDRLMPRAREAVVRIEGADLAAASDDELVAHLRSIETLVRRIALANIVSPLLLNAYGAMLRRRLEKRGIDAHQLDLGAGHPELESYDPKPRLRQLSEELAALDEPTHERVMAGEIELLPSGPAFLERFGHVSDSGNDFSSVPWREEPARIAALLSPPEPEAVGEGNDEEPPGPTRFDGVIAGRTVRYRFERERVSYLYTRAYGQFRPAVLEVARRLVERGRLDEVDDVFGLTRTEMETGLLDGATLDLRELAGPRLQEMEELAGVEMPEVIFGDEFTPAPPSDPEHTLVGIPSSRGVKRNTARVVSGVEEAAKVERGDIVVIPYSDVGWTPMLARAGGIVAESGGLLSHSSIVAREFGIPCVVSVPGAMRIPDGSVVRVDGFTGGVQWEPAA